MKIFVPIVFLFALEVSGFAETIEVNVSYRDPETGAKFYGTQPVYLLKTDLLDAADDIWVFESNQSNLLLKWIKVHIPKYYSQYWDERFRQQWPSVVIATAWPDEDGVAVFQNILPGQYHVVSLAWTRRKHHSDSEYKGSPDRRVLYDFNVWLWDMHADVGLNQRVLISMNDSNNAFRDRY